MSRLALYLFGSPQIELDHHPITVDTRKAVALLAYLAVTHKAHNRDALAALLWPEYDQSHAYAALRRTLSALNKALGGYALAIEREAIGLDDQADVWVDTEQFQHRLAECRTHGHAENVVCARCVEPLTQAVELYREDFLAGFSLRDSGDFDDWTFFQAETLRRDLAGALDRLVRHASRGAQQEYEAAITHARRWIAVDPLHEPAHRELMKLYALAGQRAAALRQYQECARVLKEELDVEPLAETTQLYETIKANRLKTSDRRQKPADGRPGSLASDQSPEIARSYPLIGRAAELAALLRLHAASRDGRFVVIEGEAGIGKTRLAEEFIQRARADGASVITGCTYEGELNYPYHVFVDALRAALSQPGQAAALDRLPVVWRTEAARLLPELTGRFADLGSASSLEQPGAQSRFFEGIRQVLLALCTPASSPGILFLDNVHWADAASLDLLTYLVRRLRGQAWSILIVWRSEDVARDHRLHALLSEAQRSGLGAALTLLPLDAPRVAELVQSAALSAKSLPSDFSERLYQETAGIPFFVVEYLEAVARGGSDWSMPASVRDLLHARLAPITEIARQLLQTAAIIGRSFDLETLREASGRGDEEIVTALEQLAAHRLICELPSGDVSQAPAYDFGHEKLRELIYQETGLARRRLLHQRVAAALIVYGHKHRRIGSAAGQIAYHFQLAGQAGEAAEYFWQAGEQARRVFANVEALAHYRAALAAGFADAAQVHEAIGHLHTLGGEYQSALRSYETAAALQHSDAHTIARLEHQIGNVYQRQGERDLAEAHYQAALNLLGSAGDPSLRAQIYNDASLNAQHQDQFDRAVDLAHHALALAQTANDQRALAQAHNVLGILSRYCEDDATAIYHLQHSLELAESLDDPGARVAALNNLALAHGDRGEVEQAIALTEQALTLCALSGDRHREAALHNNLADLLHTANRHAEAMAHLKQAVTIFAEIGVEAGTLQPEIWKLAEW